MVRVGPPSCLAPSRWKGPYARTAATSAAQLCSVSTQKKNISSLLHKHSHTELHMHKGMTDDAAPERATRNASAVQLTLPDGFVRLALKHQVHSCSRFVSEVDQLTSSYGRPARVLLLERLTCQAPEFFHIQNLSPRDDHPFFVLTDPTSKASSSRRPGLYLQTGKTSVLDFSSRSENAPI